MPSRMLTTGTSFVGSQSKILLSSQLRCFLGAASLRLAVSTLTTTEYVEASDGRL